MGNELKIYTLGKFDLKFNDVSITEDTNIQSKTWELFKYLLTHRNRSVSQEEIISVLNLDNNDDPVGALSSLVYRLRQRLKNEIGSHAGDYIKRSGNAYRFNIQKEFWLDIDEFEMACQLTNNAIKKNSDNWREPFEKILELYQGGFLEEANLRSWIWSIRNKYINLLILTFKNLTQYLGEQNKCEELFQYYSEVHQLIGFDEDLTIAFIENLLKMGKIGLAHQKYQEVLKIFEENNLILPHKLKILQDKFPKDNSDNPEHIFEQIKQSYKEDRAYICSQEIFAHIFSLEVKRNRRNPINSYLVYFRLIGEYDKSIIDEIGDDLFEIISSQLRLGDIVCRWNNNLIISIIAGLDEPEIRKVTERLHNSFYYIYDIPEGIELERSFTKINGKKKIEP